jgi:hypothetical protein
MQECRISETVGKPLKLTTKRIRFDEARIMAAFDRGYLHMANQKRPLRVRVVEDGVQMMETPDLWLVNNAPTCTGAGFVVMSTYGPFSPWQEEPIILEEYKG